MITDTIKAAAFNATLIADDVKHFQQLVEANPQLFDFKSKNDRSNELFEKVINSGSAKCLEFVLSITQPTIEESENILRKHTNLYDGEYFDINKFGILAGALQKQNNIFEHLNFKDGINDELFKTIIKTVSPEMQAEFIKARPELVENSTKFLLGNIRYLTKEAVDQVITSNINLEPHIVETVYSGKHPLTHTYGLVGMAASYHNMQAVVSLLNHDIPVRPDDFLELQSYRNYAASRGDHKMSAAIGIGALAGGMATAVAAAGAASIFHFSSGNLADPREDKSDAQWQYIANSLDKIIDRLEDRQTPEEKEYVKNFYDTTLSQGYHDSLIGRTMDKIFKHNHEFAQGNLHFEPAKPEVTEVSSVEQKEDAISKIMKIRSASSSPSSDNKNKLG